MNAHTAHPYQSAPHIAPAEGVRTKESITISGYVSTDDQIMAMNDLAAAMEMVATLAEGENYRNEADISAPQIAPLLRVFAGFRRRRCPHASKAKSTRITNAGAKKATATRPPIALGIVSAATNRAKHASTGAQKR